MSTRTAWTGPAAGSALGERRDEMEPQLRLERERRRASSRAVRATAVGLLLMLVTGGCSSAESADPSPTAGEQTSTAPDDGDTNSEEDTDLEDDADPDEAGSEPADDDPQSQPTPNGPTTPAPAAGDGDIHTEVDVEEQEYLPASDFGADVEVGNVATVTILDITRADVEARMAGEISGPGVVVTLLLANESDEELDLALVTVNAEDAAALPLNPLTGEPADPFFGALASGGSTEATYVFGLPDDASIPITVTVNPAPDAAVAVFSGDPS